MRTLTRFLRLAGRTLALLALSLAAACSSAKRAAPDPVPGWSAPVRVVTDRWGIPHIRAQSLRDLYRAWGWVSARDRLWQMALTRAQARGESHRWLGNSALRADGGAQLFRLGERADSIWARDRADTLLAMAMREYAAGVNDYLAECASGKRAWPAELVRVHGVPEPWRPEDSVALLLGFGVTLDLDAPELQEAEEIARWGMARVNERHAHEADWMYDTVPDSAAWRLGKVDFVTSRADGPRTGERPNAPLARGAERPAAAPRLDDAHALLAALRPGGGDPDQRASNEFAVGPARSASGAPILANDPHLGLGAPGPLHVVHLSVPGVLEAIGATVPGLPLVAIGRNERAAWGLTAFSADVCDVYADTLSADARRTRGPGGAPVVTRPFHLSLRVGPLTVPALGQVARYTAHGPVIQWDPKRHLAYAMRWSAMEDGRITLARLVGLERSTSAEEVVTRVGTLVTPTFSVVAADVDGDVRWRGAGLVPRRPWPFLRGPLPADGRHEWAGFIPADSMPAWRVSPAGFVVNANNRPLGVAYPYPWTRYDWAHDRALRIAELLRAKPRLTSADAAVIQNDVHSRASERWLPALLGESEILAGSLPPRAQIALERLRRWDGEVRRDRVEPTLFRSWLGALLRRMGCERLPGLAYAILQKQAEGSLSDMPKESLPRLVTGALVTALDTLGAKLGPDLDTWTWDRVTRARFRHALADVFPAEAARWEPPRVPTDGDRSSPAVSGARLPWTFDVLHGPVLRHVVDLAVRDSSLGVIAPWNVAPPPGHGAGELAERWADHRYVPFYLDWTRIEEVKADEVTLGR